MRTEKFRDLLTEEDQEVLRKYFPLCRRCGLPWTDGEICPVCGSTSRAWTCLNPGYIVYLVFSGVSFGLTLQFLLFQIFPNLSEFFVTSVFALLTLGGPPWMSGRAKTPGNSEEREVVFLVGIALLPFLAFPFLVPFGGYLVCAYYGIAWVLLGQDYFMAARSKRVSLAQILNAIRFRKERQEFNLFRIEREGERLGPGGDGEIEQIRRNLIFAGDMIRRELECLADGEKFVEAVGLFLFWKSCLSQLFAGIPRYEPGDFHIIEDINRALRGEIQPLMEEARTAVKKGHMGAVELLRCLEAFVPLHEKIRDALAMRRARKVLSDVEICRTPEFPGNCIPLPMNASDSSGDILEWVSASFQWLKPEKEGTIATRITDAWENR